MKKLLKYHSFLYFLLLSFALSSFGQGNIPDIKTLQKKYGKNQSIQKSRLLEIIEDSLALQDTAKIDTMEIDTLEEEEEKLSIYENLLRGEIINPDSLIKDLEIFGHSVFRKKELPSFVSEKQISVPADYPVSSGDEVIIIIWGRINEEHHLTVDRSGHINIPRIGPVPVAGISFKAMQRNIVNRIQNIEGVQASVSMGTLSDVRIFIIGDVNVPGQYTVSAMTNVTNALFYADGFSKQGSMRNVKLKRNGRTIKTFDFYDFLMAGDNFSNIRLKTGDVIFVPVVKKMAAIAGNVRRSALYELKGKTTLKEMIHLAGGLTPAAWVNRIQIERFQANDQKVVLDLEVSSAEKLPDLEIEDGDIIKIFPIVMVDKNAVYLLGNVLRPGKYEYHDNMRVSAVINNYEQLLPETYFNYAVIRRRESPSYAERIVSFNLGSVLEDSSSVENIILKPLDNIIIYDKDFFEPNRIVSIDGAVTNPGTYKLLENMRIKDLILEAGGLREDASTERGELYKRTYIENSVKTLKIDFSIKAAMQDDPDHNILLSKFDHISIRVKLGWEEQKIITLVGEFNYPGTYVILEGETLGELLRRAGGFKPDAYLPAAILTRESVKEIEKKRKEEYIHKLEADIAAATTEIASKGTIGPEVYALLDMQKNLLEKLRETEVFGRVVVDFEKEKNYQDLHIENGDALYVPRNYNTVSVLGEVYNPSTFVLDNYNTKMSHYIEQAGGYKDNANKKDVYVIKANGSVKTRQMMRMSRYNLESGDAVVVPLRLPPSNVRFKLILETTKDILAITSSTLMIAVAIAALK